MIGSSQEPCTMNGSSNGRCAGLGAATSAAVPLRSSSRVGIEAEPASASRTAGPVDLHVVDVDRALSIFSATAILSKGVRPVRKSPPPDSGRRSSRRSNCSTLRPASAPSAPVRLAVPFKRVGQRQHAVAGAFDREAKSAFAFEPVQPEQLAEAAFQIDVGKLQLRFDVDAVDRNWRAPTSP